MRLLLYITLTVFTCFEIRAQNDTFFCADYSGGKVFLMENEKIIWEYPAPFTDDLWVLPSGNMLFTSGHSVLEVNYEKDILFRYESSSYIFACQRLKNGNTFIGECNTGKMLEVDPGGNIVYEVSILPKGVVDGGFDFMRNARQLENGNYLVAHYGSEEVKEYNREGKEIWCVKVDGGPHSVIRLENGNTLVAVADRNQNPRILEINSEGKTVWSFSNSDLPDKSLNFIGGMHYLPGGMLYFTNWVGHEKPKRRIHLFCVNRNKEILLQQKGTKEFKTMSSIFSVDAFKSSKIYH